jgi:hypothetical protein
MFNTHLLGRHGHMEVCIREGATRQHIWNFRSAHVGLPCEWGISGLSDNIDIKTYREALFDRLARVFGMRPV